MDDRACPNCSRPRDQWPDDAAGGYTKDGAVYCCQGCIEGSGCTCIANREQVSAATPTKEDIRDDPASGVFVQSLDKDKKQVRRPISTPAVTKAPVSDASND